MYFLKEKELKDLGFTKLGALHYSKIDEKNNTFTVYEVISDKKYKLTQQTELKK